MQTVIGSSLSLREPAAVQTPEYVSPRDQALHMAQELSKLNLKGKVLGSYISVLMAPCPSSVNRGQVLSAVLSNLV